MAKIKNPLDNFRFNLDDKKNPELYWGLRVALPYNIIGITFGFFPTAIFVLPIAVTFTVF